MASGHAYRARRPNTWLLRPTPQVKILLANPEPSRAGSRKRARPPPKKQPPGVALEGCIGGDRVCRGGAGRRQVAGSMVGSRADCRERALLLQALSLTESEKSLIQKVAGEVL